MAIYITLYKFKLNFDGVNFFTVKAQHARQKSISNNNNRNSSSSSRASEQ